MILYGSPEELVKALQEEVEKLLSLKGRDAHLDKFIDMKLRMLKDCIEKTRKTTYNTIQIVALNNCYIIEI
ncbi:MAG: type II/IV secretion system protein [Thermoproteus sp.]